MMGGRPTRAEAAVSPLEVWGGVECSVVRVGGGWRDQVIETGHHDRPGDLDLIAAARHPDTALPRAVGTAGARPGGSFRLVLA